MHEIKNTNISILHINASIYYHLYWTPMIFLSPIDDEAIATCIIDCYYYIWDLASLNLPSIVRHNFTPLFVLILAMFYIPLVDYWKSERRKGLLSDEFFNLL